MKRRLSPSKVSQEIAHRFQEDRPINKVTDYNRYFCHYNEGLYMGGMSGYKKHGKGLVLHDDGSAMVSDYLHDTPTGHNIIFRENSLTSILYLSPSEFQIAYKQSHYIILIPFNDGSHKANGPGILLDYYNHRIFRLHYKKGVLCDKILHLDKKDNEDVFSRGKTTKIIGVKHQQAFELTFEKPKGMHINSEGNKKTIGYFDENGEMSGLSFTVYSQNLKTNGEKPLYLKLIERGYYSKSQMHIYGQKMFSNGNQYIGEFQEGQFHGYGILVSPAEKKWVFGKFYHGQLSQIQESNYKQYSQKDYDNWNGNVKVLHRRFRERWIDTDVVLPEENYLYGKLKLAIEREMTHIDPDRELVTKEEETNLSRIQQQFEKQKPGSLINSKVERQLEHHYQGITPISTGHPIRIESDEFSMSSDKMVETPVHRMKSSHNSETISFGEGQFMMEDPFQIQLKKVPFTEQYNQPALSNELYYTSSPRQTHSPSRTIHQPLRKTFQETSNRSSREKKIHKDTVYKGLMEEFRLQKEGLNYEPTSYEQELRMSIENRRFRRSSRSPPHQEYIASSASGHSNNLPRYSGKVTNKRHFNYEIREQPFRTRAEEVTSQYPTTSKYSSRLNERKDSYSPPLYKNSYRPQEGNIYSSGRSPGRRQPEQKNFIRNNYQYWS